MNREPIGSNRSTSLISAILLSWLAVPFLTGDCIAITPFRRPARRKSFVNEADIEASPMMGGHFTGTEAFGITAFLGNSLRPVAVVSASVVVVCGQTENVDDTRLVIVGISPHRGRPDVFGIDYFSERAVPNLVGEGR